MENIWEVAKNMELEGEEYYRKLAESVGIDQVKGVFLFLADQKPIISQSFLFMLTIFSACVIGVIAEAAHFIFLINRNRATLFIENIVAIT